MNSLSTAEKFQVDFAHSVASTPASVCSRSGCGAMTTAAVTVSIAVFWRLACTRGLLLLTSRPLLPVLFHNRFLKSTILTHSSRRLNNFTTSKHCANLATCSSFLCFSISSFSSSSVIPTFPTTSKLFFDFLNSPIRQLALLFGFAFSTFHVLRRQPEPIPLQTAALVQVHEVDFVNRFAIAGLALQLLNLKFATVSTLTPIALPKATNAEQML